MPPGDLNHGEVFVHPPWGGRVTVDEEFAEAYMIWDVHYLEFWDKRLDDD